MGTAETASYLSILLWSLHEGLTIASFNEPPLLTFHIFASTLQVHRFDVRLLPLKLVTLLMLPKRNQRCFLLCLSYFAQNILGCLLFGGVNGLGCPIQLRYSPAVFGVLGIVAPIDVKVAPTSSVWHLVHLNHHCICHFL